MNRLGDSVRVIFLDDEASAREVLEAARNGPSGSSVIWLWRRTRDISPGSFVTKLEQDLGVGREVRQREFVAYSLPERWARRLLRGPGNPNTITVCPNSGKRRSSPREASGGPNGALLPSFIAGAFLLA